MNHANDHLNDLDLLAALDQELPADRRAVVAAHLAQCAVCAERRVRVSETADHVGAFYRGDVVTPVEFGDVTRERLRANLSELTVERNGSSRLSIPRWAIVGAAVAATVLLIRFVSPARPIVPAAAGAAVEHDALPVAALTPGATWKLSVAELCSAGTREQRPIAPLVRQVVLRDYGMERVPREEYELDYLITPELGGAPDPRNLWPQRYSSRVWNAHVKDQLEQLLPRLVCDRQVPLETAQRDIARDWVAAYKKYFRTDRPLQAQASLLEDEPSNAGGQGGVMYPVWRSANAPTLELIAFSPRR